MVEVLFINRFPFGMGPKAEQNCRNQVMMLEVNLFILLPIPCKGTIHYKKIQIHTDLYDKKIMVTLVF